MILLNAEASREQGRKAQLANIKAAKAISDIVRTTLGPRSMLKMLLDPMGGIVLTNDGNAILREIDVSHPAAKSIIEISRTQDEEVGDGTTTVAVLAGEIMVSAQPFIEKEIHPTLIVGSYFQALEFITKVINNITKEIKPNEINSIVESCIATKFSTKWGKLIAQLAIDAVNKITVVKEGKKKEIDIKRYARVEKIPGGALEDSVVLDGVILNKDVTHAQMPRKLENPRVVLLDCNLEYKKGESMTNMEFNKEEDFKNALRMEEEEVKKMCDHIIRVNANVVITEKGISDIAQHYLLKYNIAAIRRVRKTDNNRLSRCTGATIVNRPEELQQSDVGKLCGLYEIKLIGDEYFAYFIKCKEPKACSIILRGGSKDVLNEMERNLQDALSVAKNVTLNPKLVPGGGAAEMEISARLEEYSKTLKGAAQWPVQALSQAFEVIPRTLAQNAGADVIKVVTELRAKHSQNGANFGINGMTGEICDMTTLNVWDPVEVKLQTYKSAMEVSCMLLRIDDVVSGIKKEKRPKPGVQEAPPQQEGAETFGDRRDG
jgi:T-complex protein 1 subunit gamma